jgi:hypothetical protein
MNFYHDTYYPNQLHKLKLVWTPECHTAYYTNFTLLFKDAFLQYDHIFHIQHCHARDIQLGAVLFPNGMPITH